MAKEDFYLSDEQRMTRDLARNVAREKVAPHAAYVDETETYAGRHGHARPRGPADDPPRRAAARVIARELLGR